jgi:hypothetical protein
MKMDFFDADSQVIAIPKTDAYLESAKVISDKINALKLPQEQHDEFVFGLLEHTETARFEAFSSGLKLGIEVGTVKEPGEPDIFAVTKVDRWGCCYNERGEHNGSFEPMPLSNDDIFDLFIKYAAEKMPAFVDQDEDGTTYTTNVIIFRDVSGRIQFRGLKLIEIINSSDENFELRTEITGLIYC